MPVLPQEIWLRIARTALPDLYSLALSSRQLTGPSNECLYYQLDFASPDIFHDRCSTWRSLDSRVFDLVRVLSLGVIQMRDDSDIITHSSYRFDVRPKWTVFQSSLSLFTNLKSISLIGVHIREDMFAMVESLSQLKVFTLERVCIDGATPQPPFRSSSIRDLSLISTCWHHQNRSGLLITGCVQCESLTITWNTRHSDSLQPLLPANLVSYKKLSLDVSAVNWRSGSSANACRAAFASFVDRFGNISSLVISGKLPLFHSTDFASREFCTRLVNYSGSVLFMGALHHLRNIVHVTLTDFSLVDNDLLVSFPTVFYWSTLRLQAYMWDEEVVKQLLGCSLSLVDFTIDVGDDDIDWIDVLNFLSTILECRPRLTKLTINACIPPLEWIPLNKYDALKELCPTLTVLVVDQRMWKNRLGMWSEVV